MANDKNQLSDRYKVLHEDGIGTNKHNDVVVGHFLAGDQRGIDYLVMNGLVEQTEDELRSGTGTVAVSEAIAEATDKLQKQVKELETALSTEKQKHAETKTEKDGLKDKVKTLNETIADLKAAVKKAETAKAKTVVVSKPQ
jgi:vacuolar-type H+-ATPase subunit I/STV1